MGRDSGKLAAGGLRKDGAGPIVPSALNAEPGARLAQKVVEWFQAESRERLRSALARVGS